MRPYHIVVLLGSWLLLSHIIRQFPAAYWQGLSAYALLFGWTLVQAAMLGIFQWKYGSRERTTRSYLAEGDRSWSLRFLSVMLTLYAVVFWAVSTGYVDNVPVTDMLPGDLERSYRVIGTGQFALKAFLHYCPQVIIAPICEEFLFRGTLLTYFKRHYSRWTAWIICTVLFVLQHNIYYRDFGFFIQQGAGLLFVGIALMAVAERARSLAPAIILHAVHNLYHVALELGRIF